MATEKELEQRSRELSKRARESRIRIVDPAGLGPVPPHVEPYRIATAEESEAEVERLLKKGWDERLHVFPKTMRQTYLQAIAIAIGVLALAAFGFWKLYGLMEDAEREERARQAEIRETDPRYSSSREDRR